MADFTKDSRLWSCACARKSGCLKPFHSAAALKQQMQENCRLLQGGFHPFNMIAPELKNVIATTIGSNSLMSACGRVGHIQTAGDRFDCTPAQITLRTSSDIYKPQDTCLVAISNVDEVSHRPPALHAFDQTGRVVHRIDITNSEDACVLAASCASLREWRGAHTLLERENSSIEKEGNVVSIVPFLKARKSWHELNIEDHLDTILPNAGRNRQSLLARLSTDYAWKVDSSAIAHCFRFLAHRRVSFTQIHVQPTLLQAHVGVIDELQSEDGIVFLNAQNSSAAIDVNSIENAWVVQYGYGNTNCLALELYDHNKDCIALLSIDPHQSIYNKGEWVVSLLSLPRAGGPAPVVDEPD